MILVALAFGIGQLAQQPINEHSDLIELNHKFDRDGRHTFSQVIFWERHRGTGKYQVRDWVIVDDRESLCAVPTKHNGLYCSVFVKEGLLYSVRSPLFRESWTHTDPELEDAKRHPKSERRLLKRTTFHTVEE